MKILITGAGGFLGRGMLTPFEASDAYQLRLMDVVPFDSKHETVVGSVEDLDFVRRQVAGMDAIIIAHMAPREPNAYQDPTRCIDINVKGTANLLFAAQEAGISRIVVISSTSALDGYGKEEMGYRHERVAKTGKSLYSLTKAQQEQLAEHFSRNFEMKIACLRVGYVLDGESMKDKYGRDINERAVPDTDRRDIGEVARLSLELEDLQFETFIVMSTRESMQVHDVQYTCNRLNWQPRYDFDVLKPSKDCIAILEKMKT